MKKVKLFCMQKDEDDILHEWIIYHSYLFGIKNIYIIDNNSDEKSKNILDFYQTKGLNVFTRPDYSRKGEYICELIKNVSSDCDIAIPLDLDEFISVVDVKNIPKEFALKFASQCLSFDPSFYLKQYPDIQATGKLTEHAALEHFIKYGFSSGKLPCPIGQERSLSERVCLDFMENNANLILKNHPEWGISCDKEQILSIINSLIPSGRYAFMYYLASRNNELEYQSPIEDVFFFDKVDMENHLGKGNYNKKFFDAKLLQGLDHGHHYGRVEGLSQFQCRETQLFLFHYHHRGVKRLVQKCKNDIRGFGHVKNIDDQKELKEKIKQNVPGAHNIETYLNYLCKGPYSLYMSEDGAMEIKVMSEKMTFLKKNNIIP